MKSFQRTVTVYDLDGARYTAHGNIQEYGLIASSPAKATLVVHSAAVWGVRERMADALDGAVA